MVYNEILHLDLLPAVHKAMVYKCMTTYLYIYIIIYIYILQKTYITLKRSFSARLPSKMKLSKLKNQAFLRDFLQKWSFEALKRSFSARLPSKMKASKLKNPSFSARLPSKMELRSSKNEAFCETSFKNEASKLKNEGFARDFLQKWSFETQKPSFSARLPSKMILRARIGSQATTKGTHQFCVTGVILRARIGSQATTNGTHNFCDRRGDSKHTWSLVTLSILVQNVETVNRVTSDQCTVLICL